MTNEKARSTPGSESFACDWTRQVVLRTGGLIDIEKLRPGDELMGSDGRTVVLGGVTLRTVPAYEVQARKSAPFLVGADQPLLLCDRELGVPTLMTAQKVAVLPPRLRRRVGLPRAPLTFAPKYPLLVDPYFMGLLLSSGSCRRGGAQLTGLPPELAQAVHEIAEHEGWSVVVRKRILSLRKNKGLISKLRMLGLMERGKAKRFIPRAYLRAARGDRLSLLAGIFDAEGTLTHRTYDLTTASVQFAQDVAFLARGLGFGVQEKVKSLRSGVYQRLYIYGDFSILPRRSSNKVPVRPGQLTPLCAPFEIREAGVQEIYELEVDSYLMGDLTVRKGGVL